MSNRGREEIKCRIERERKTSSSNPEQSYVHVWKNKDAYIRERKKNEITHTHTRKMR